MAAADDRDDAASSPQTDVAEGIDHLQAAAREMIRAARSLLDAAEGIVEEPGAVHQLAGTLQGLAGAAATWLRSTSASGADPADDSAPAGKVQRIDLS